MTFSGSIDVAITVTDESGATNTTLLTLDSIPALTCPNLTQTVTDQNVRLDWTWDSSETASFEIMPNGVTVGVTNETTFKDKPSLIATSPYQVQTMLGDRILESSCQSPVVDVVIESSTTDFEQGPSSVAGLGLGSVYAIIGILLFVSSLLRRGE